MISGKSGHGKDTAAQMMKDILEKQQQRVLVIHFADLVKHYAFDYYNWDGQKQEAGRALLQKIGTEMMRTHFPTYWAEIVGKFIAVAGQLNDFDYCLIPDWRFKNEFTTVYEYNTGINPIYRVRVERNGYRNPAMTDEQFYHISETELDNTDFDWLIDNHDDLTTLNSQVKLALLYIDTHSKTCYNKRKGEN